MKMKTKFIFGLFFITTLFGCGNKSEARNERKIDEQIEPYYKNRVQQQDLELNLCYNLNVKAVELIESNNIQYKTKKDKDITLRKAISILDSCIKKDINCIDAYLNKSLALRRLGEYEQSLNVLLNVPELNKQAEALFGIGIIYEKQGNSLKAKTYLKKSVVAYNYLIAKEGPRFDLLDSKELVLLILEGKDKRLDNIKSLLKKNPNDEDLIDRKRMIDYFDAKKFIETF
jgi:tetratricopeptide (TPR) repeat protein